MALTRVSRHIIDEPFNPTTVSATDVTATNINASGIGTVGTLNVTGNLTVQGTTTTLDTILTEVDKLEVGANNSTVGVAITQSGSGANTIFTGGYVRVNTDVDSPLELNVTDDLEIKLNHAWITVDAGEIAYEDGIKAQVEGGFIQAASWALYEEVIFDSKEIISKDWDSYKIIGFDNIPVFTTSVIDQKGSPYLGVGEVVAGPTGAAISNALCNALGQRIKILPFTKDNITKELLN